MAVVGIDSGMVRVGIRLLGDRIASLGQVACANRLKSLVWLDLGNRVNELVGFDGQIRIQGSGRDKQG